jgi:hypothetical protein
MAAGVSLSGLSGRRCYFLEIYFQFFSGDGVEEVLQLMQIFDAHAGRRGMTQPEAVVTEFEIRMCITVSQDPFVPDEIAETATFEDLWRQCDGYYLLYLGLFDDFEYFGGIGGVIKAADLGQMPSAYIDCRIVDDGVGVNLLDCDYFAPFVEYLVPIAEIFYV